MSTDLTGGSSHADPIPAGESHQDGLRPWIGLVCRLVLGGALIFAGATKVGSPLVAARAVQAYQILPFDLAGYVGIALPIIEIVIGALLILGLFTRPAAIAGTFLMVVFIAGITSVWVRGISIDCGCFGGGGTVAPGETKYAQDIARDVVFALCGLWLILRPRTRLSVDHLLSSERTSR